MSRDFGGFIIQEDHLSQRGRVVEERVTWENPSSVPGNTAKPVARDGRDLIIPNPMLKLRQQVHEAMRVMRRAPRPEQTERGVDAVVLRVWSVRNRI